jgi:orotidine-5'-phosphate decarboxylase
LWPAAIAAGGGSTGKPDERAARAVLAHCRLSIEAVAPECVGVKLQLACFERLGVPGWEALRAVCEVAREQGLAVIADAKRGDIDVTAAAYAQAFFGGLETPWGAVDGLGADAMTANPLLGRDSLGPLITTARDYRAGVFVLVRTSNPGAEDLQDLPLARGGSVSERLAAMVSELGQSGIGEHGLGDVGAVVGATAPEWIDALRLLMPNAIFLLPGVGAQGGEVERLGAAFAPGRAGALLPVSRAIVNAHEDAGRDPPDAARRVAAKLREAAWSLSG